MRLLIMNPPVHQQGPAECSTARVPSLTSSTPDIIISVYFVFFFMSSLDADKYDNLRGAQINQPVIGIGQDST